MAAPVITFTASDDATGIDATTNPDAIGTLQAGAASATKEIHIWNNKAGISNVSTAGNVKITTVTKTGLDSGDTIANGKEVVEQKMIKVKSLTNEDTVYTAVGGATTLTLADIRGEKIISPTGLTKSFVVIENGWQVPSHYYYKVSAFDETGETLPSTEIDAGTFPVMKEETTESATSETIDTTTNTRIAWKFVPDLSAVNLVAIRMSSGGWLQGKIRIETDDAGSPSGTLADSAGESAQVYMSDSVLTQVNFNSCAVTPSTTYWIVFVVNGGSSGTFKGKGTGTTRNVKYYDGTWHNSANLYEMRGNVSYYNAIRLNWTAVTGATGYRVYRTSSTGTYTDPCFKYETVTNQVDDDNAYVYEGEPLGSASNTFGHNHKVIRKLEIPSTATAGGVDFFAELRYTYI